MPNGTSRLLLKLASTSGRSLAQQTFGLAGGIYTLEPLFDTAPAPLGATASAQWMLASSSTASNFLNPWDAAHHAVTEGIGLADGIAILAEPDLEHEWPHAEGQGLQPAIAPLSPCQESPQNSHWPFPPADLLWHLGDKYSQLGQARQFVGDDSAKRVRILHLDTGYDRAHLTMPLYFDPNGLQKNFVEGTDNAQDPGNTGLLRNPGHGTGTLGLLAGNRLTGMDDPRLNTGDFLGGAPYATIIPVRIANSVVHFWTSTMARGIAYSVDNSGKRRADVVSISMGGLASAAWADAVNAAYEAGVCIVAAAGNNYGGLPTRNIVYPARFGRVIAACGATSDQTPYFQASLQMQGNFGPAQKMTTAIAAYTPNVPWAKYGCSRTLDLDGAGTSAATPQVAAAAALWLQHHGPEYEKPWMRIEALRQALFGSTLSAIKDDTHFGQGLLQARSALNLAPAPAEHLHPQPVDQVSFPLFRILTGVGFAASPRGSMLELEALQLVQKVRELAEINENAGLDDTTKLRQLTAGMIEAPETSNTLRAYLKQRIGATAPPRNPTNFTSSPNERSSTISRGQRSLPIERPPFRRLRVYAFDPSLDTEMENALVNRVILKVPWESDKVGNSSLQPGPIGEYIEVIDVDPASKCTYEPVDLDNKHLLAQDGLAPSEGNPQFHQQMVYAVTMRTIRNFEKALGRRSLWAVHRSRPRQPDGRLGYANEFVQRLRIYPHALREANAYYSPKKIALLFGYFPAFNTNPSEQAKRGTVFTCLSHDIIAHETTHALLDGMHRRFNESTNPDVLAFHEAFADIVALLQHFSLPDVLHNQIAKARGNLQTDTLLAQLAQQFGNATGLHGALRDAIGEKNENGQWTRKRPDPSLMETLFEPHARGSLLVAAVFDAFLAIYETRTADLVRIATQGTGILPAGAIHPDLVNRLAKEASKAASQLLSMCIRALDYCPPVDLTFGDYLRALITADRDLVPDDDLNYRVAVIEAFRRRGIYPGDVRSLSEDSLRWYRPTDGDFDPFRFSSLISWLEEDLRKWDLDTDRIVIYNKMEKLKERLHERLSQKIDSEVFAGLALDGHNAKFEVHSIRPIRRVGPDGQVLLDAIIEITQRRRGYFNPASQHPNTDYDFSPTANAPEPDFIFRGGGTLIIDLQSKEVRYYIYKDIRKDSRLDRQRRFLTGDIGASLREMYFGSGTDEPFALLHRCSHSEDTRWTY